MSEHPDYKYRPRRKPKSNLKPKEGVMGHGSSGSKFVKVAGSVSSTSPSATSPGGATGGGQRSLFYPFQSNFLNPALESFHHAVVRSFFPFPPPPPLTPEDKLLEQHRSLSLFPYQPSLPFYPRLFDLREKPLLDEERDASPETVSGGAQHPGCPSKVPTKFSSIPALCAPVSKCSECVPHPFGGLADEPRLTIPMRPIALSLQLQPKCPAGHEAPPTST